MENVYKVIEIFETDFGCEEWPEGQELLTGVRLCDANGSEKILTVADKYLYEQNISEGIFVCLKEGKFLQRIVEVSAALIWKKDKFLICQRPPHKGSGLLWEFVGGKVEAGETKEEALIRECREELAIKVSVGDVFAETVHEYPDITVHLTVFRAEITEGIPKPLEHEDLRWITVKEVGKYDFCPTAEVTIRKLRFGETAASGV